MGNQHAAVCGQMLNCCNGLTCDDQTQVMITAMRADSKGRHELAGEWQIYTVDNQWKGIVSIEVQGDFVYVKQDGRTLSVALSSFFRNGDTIYHNQEPGRYNKTAFPREIVFTNGIFWKQQARLTKSGTNIAGSVHGNGISHGCIVVFEKPDGSLQTVTLTRRPFGMRINAACDNFTGAKVTYVEENGGHARELGIEVDWVFDSVGGAKCKNMEYDDVVSLIGRYTSNIGTGA